ncbi:hypothetical protein NPIL_449271 [Nephila pilipes]|uniref:Uncharacterized protein n=1 Tax=Nephila pilipes TaxID=299642 RepID=A0A8X6N395_NEPPI|nr:hypothetical protein NPIL_449271 [Nephila pilipes]
MSWGAWRSSPAQEKFCHVERDGCPLFGEMVFYEKALILRQCIALCLKTFQSEEGTQEELLKYIKENNIIIGRIRRIIIIIGKRINGKPKPARNSTKKEHKCWNLMWHTTRVSTRDNEKLAPIQPDETPSPYVLAIDIEMFSQCSQTLPKSQLEPGRRTLKTA